MKINVTLRRILLALAAVSGVTACHPPMQYSKLGLTQAVFDAEYMQCVRLANVMATTPVAPNEYYKVSGIIDHASFEGTIRRQPDIGAELANAYLADGRRNAIVDSCMEAKGYTLHPGW